MRSKLEGDVAHNDGTLIVYLRSLGTLSFQFLTRVTAKMRLFLNDFRRPLLLSPLKCFGCFFVTKNLK